MDADWTIRRARDADADALLGVWERSVRATHDFLTEEDIVGLRPHVAQALAHDALELWVLADAGDAPVGFMGLAGNGIAALFPAAS
jgi:putative acetyltransferase